MCPLPAWRGSLRAQPDERLAELAGVGYEAAFEAIVYRYRRALLRHCAQLVGDTDAEEAVQDALMKAHRALTRGVAVHSLEAWLHTIAHNSALTLLRTRPPGAEYREDLDVGHEGTGAPREQLDALVSAFLMLPARQRRALVMRELEGRSYDEIAAQLEASNGAVRALLNRARASVRERLSALIPAELVLRWITVAAGSGPSRAVTLAGTGALGAKISTVILMSAAPIVAVAPVTPVPSVTRVTTVTRPRAAVPAPARHAARVVHHPVAAAGGSAGAAGSRLRYVSTPARTPPPSVRLRSRPVSSAVRSPAPGAAVAPGGQVASSSASSCSTRPAMSSRVARTSSMGRPAGSASSQSMYRLPGM